MKTTWDDINLRNCVGVLMALPGCDKNQCEVSLVDEQIFQVNVSFPVQYSNPALFFGWITRNEKKMLKGGGIGDHVQRSQAFESLLSEMYPNSTRNDPIVRSIRHAL